MFIHTTMITSWFMETHHSNLNGGALCGRISRQELLAIGEPRNFSSVNQGFPKNKNWLVVFTILKNISQWEGLSHILWKKIQMFQTTNQLKRFTSSIPPFYGGFFFTIGTITKNHRHSPKPWPIESMYGIYANIGGILMVNVTIHSIHGSYGW